MLASASKNGVSLPFQFNLFFAGDSLIEEGANQANLTIKSCGRWLLRRVIDQPMGELCGKMFGALRWAVFVFEKIQGGPEFPDFHLAPVTAFSKEAKWVFVF